MSKVVNISKQEEIIEQASIWIARLDSGLSYAQENEFKQWLAESPEHMVELTKLTRLWDEMEVLSNLSDMIPHEQPPEKSTYKIAAFGWTAACVFGLILVTVLLLDTLSPDFLTPKTNQLVQESGVYETPIGGVSTIALSDGSTLRLNTNTLADVRFEKSKRSIHLQRGEIHIDVAHDKTRPLSVIASGRIFQAIGTGFSVRINDNLGVKLLVTDGKVKVLPRSKSNPNSTPLAEFFSSKRAVFFESSDEIITKDQILVLEEDSRSLKKITATDVAAELSWQNQNIIFRGESLQEAINEVSRYTNIELLIADDSLLELRIAGLFKAGDVSGFLASLDANFDIAYKQDAKKTLIYSRKNMPPE